jgi:redox-sensitive bicupin YhaK (pirin superfamily)
MKSRKIQIIRREKERHWVGDGFYVSTMFYYGIDGHNISPFLLLDYAAPSEFSPSDIPRGVGQHPHRGFETVTIVYAGEVEHKDTAGNSGKIGPGDVQWMTAAHGVLHEEKHSIEFSKKGGRMEMIQLWVNLPAKNKMSEPRYQGILNKNIPVVEQEGSSIRIIAGSFNNLKGAAKTFTPIHLYDTRLKAGASLNLPVDKGFNASLLVLDGKVQIEGETIVSSELALFDQNEGDEIVLKAEKDSKILFMSGEPINEPIVGEGPFVMNTDFEIRQAFSDYRDGTLQ